MIDIIVRCCGHGEWMPIIRTVDGWGNGTELYRGERHPTHEAAWRKAVEVWDSSGTGNIVEFKRERDL